jgi:hypothetical protein
MLPLDSKQDRHDDDLCERGAPAHPAGIDVDTAVDELAERACRLTIRAHVPRHHPAPGEKPKEHDADDDDNDEVEAAYSRPNAIHATAMNQAYAASAAATASL